jgi:hypothetical protein
MESLRRLRALTFGLGLALCATGPAYAGPQPVVPPHLPGVETETWLVTVRATQTNTWAGTGEVTVGDCTRTTNVHGDEGVTFDAPRAAPVHVTRLGKMLLLSGAIPVRGVVDRRARGTDRYSCPEGAAEFQGVSSGCGGHPFSAVVALSLDTRTNRLGILLQPTTGVPQLDFCKPGFGVLFPGTVQAEAAIRPAVLFGDADVLRFRASAGSSTKETQLHLVVRGNAVTTWEVEMFPALGDPRAVPGTYRAVTRAGTVKLDGSRSRAKRGRIVKHRWTFAPGAGCPPGVQLRSGGKDGARVSVKLLCPIVATLTVTDNRGRTDARSTRIGVTARTGQQWKTKVAHRKELATGARGPVSPPAFVSTPLGAGIQLTGGVNTTDCGEEAPGSMILCPTIGGPGSWRGKSYELKRLDDPRGPFDGSWYVASASIEVKRVALINPTLTPGVPVFPNRGSFYDENARLGNPVAAFLEAVEQHEGEGKPGVPDSGHTGVIRRLIEGDLDPRKRAETLFAASESRAQKDVDDALHKIDDEVDQASNDPLPQIWNSGPLAFWNEATGAWVPVAMFHVP